MRQYRRYSWMILVLAGMLVAGCTSAGAQTPVVQTVVQTLQVEVTRNVMVTHIVEVTRDVMVTQLVEQLVTVTPVVPEATPIVQSQNQTAAVLVNITPQTTPQDKYMGFTPIFVQNKTNDKMDVFLTGPDEFNLVLWGGNQQKIWASEGGYAYTVWINGQEAYHGKLNIVSADKYNLLLHADKAVLGIP